MTIEQLAAETSMTVRNIRNHQSRGLIDGPVVRGRVGYYDDSHVDRLRLIRRLQDDGLALKAIQGLLMPESSKIDAFREVILQPVATRGTDADDLATLVPALSRAAKDSARAGVSLERAVEVFATLFERARAAEAERTLASTDGATRTG